MALKNKRVLFVVPALTGGGAERVVSVLASGLAKKGITTFILVNHRCDKEYPVGKDVYICSLPEKYCKTKNIVSKFKKIYARYKIMKEINPDIIIPFLWGGMVSTFVCNLIMRKVYISTIRVNPNEGGRCYKALRDFIISCSTACFVQNNEQKEYFSKRIQKKTFVVPNPISEQFLKFDRDYKEHVIEIVTAGRLEKQKNQAMIIYAMQELNKVMPEVKLKIYGIGREYESLNDLIKMLESESTVELCGRCEQMQDVYEQADIFVLSSDFEGMPNALMEAMAMGLPCISTDCPTGPRDLIKNGENGILISVGNTQELVEALLELCKNKEYRQKLGTNAQEEMKTNYTIDAVVELLCQELEKYS